MYYVTSEIKSNKKLKKLLDNNLNFSPYNLEKEIEFFHGPKNSMLVGTAYEILFQIELLKYKKNKFDMRYMKYARSVMLIQDMLKIYSEQDKEKIMKMIKKIQESEFILYKYIEGKEIKNTMLLKAILYLGFISEIRTREDVFIKNFVFDKDDLKDLKQLKKGIFDKLLKKYGKEQTEFHVGIGAGLLVGEIDILKRGKHIIDIKTTREGIFSKDMIYQLIMYYFLCKFNGIKIKKISIFFARFGKHETIKISDLIKKESERKILKYLKKKYQI